MKLRRKKQEKDTGLVEYVEAQADRIERNTDEILLRIRAIEEEVKTMAREQ